jgi:hypothetical protein
MKRLFILLTALSLAVFVSAARAQVTLTDIGASAPTPGTNDIYQFLTGSQNDNGINYYFDAANPPGQTFTTGPSSVGWVLSSVAMKTAGGGGSDPTQLQGYDLYIYSVSGATATLLATYSVSSFTFTENDWFQWTGLNTPLAANHKYAYTLHRVINGWEHMADQGGNPYGGGDICAIPPAGGAINYGNGTNISDAVFDIGLSIPQIPVAAQPICNANVSNIYEGSVITLTEVANGPPTLNYQWLSDGGTGGSLAPVGDFAASSALMVDTTGFTVGNTYNYAVIVTNSFGSVTSSVVALNITSASAPTIVADTTVSPDSTTNFVGLSATLTADIEGTLPIAYQWQVSPNPDGSDAVSVPGGTNEILVLTNLQTTNTGYYSLNAMNAVSPFATNSVWMQLTVVPITNQLFNWSSPVPFLGLSAARILTNVPGAYLEAAFFGSAAGPIPVIINGTTLDFTGDGSSASVTNAQGQTVGAWLVGTNTTGDTNFDAVLNNYAYNSSTNYHTITIKNLVVGQQYSVQIFAVENNDPGRLNNFQDPNNAADVSTTFGMGNNEYIVGTFVADSTNVAVQQNLLLGTTPTLGNINAVVVRALSYQPAIPPTFLSQPSSAGAFPGRTVQFSTTATGIPAPTYLWQVNNGSGWVNLANGIYGDVTISGSTNTTLIVSNLNLDDNGWQFMATATNSVGGTNSSAVVLTVNTPPPLSGAYSTNVLALNPVAYWPLNENNSDPYNGGVSGVGVYDASGNNFDGLYLFNAENGYDGIVGPQPADGYPQFTVGQSAFEPQTPVPLPNSWVITPALNLNTNTVTYIMWLDPNGAQAASTGLLFNRNTGTVGGMCYDGTGTRLGYTWNNNDSATWGYGSGPIIPTNIWSMVALVITPTNAEFYVINTNSGVTSTTFVHNHNAMAWNGSSSLITLGTDTANLNRTFNGVIDEPAVFKYALTASQLTSLSGETIPVNTNPATLGFAFNVGGGIGNKTMNFSWAPDHLGWQIYTNSVGLTASNSWFPVAGSASVTNESIEINPVQPNVFFQLRYP